MQPADKAASGPFTAESRPAGRPEESQAKAGAIGGRSVKEIAELQDQVKKLSDLVSTFIPFFKKKIEEQESRINELESQLNGVGSTINNHMSQLTTLNSSLMTTITSQLGQIQGDCQRLTEQLQDNAKVQKEIQDQQSTLMKLALKDALKDGSVEIVGMDELKK